MQNRSVTLEVHISEQLTVMVDTSVVLPAFDLMTDTQLSLHDLYLGKAAVLDYISPNKSHHMTTVI